MAFSLSGLGSGLDTASLVQSLMQAERLPATKIQARQQVAVKQVAAWNDLRTKMQAIQTTAEALQTPSKALGVTATTSDDKAVKVTATSSASPGQYSLKVHQLATAQQQVKSGLGPLSMTVGAGRSYLSAGPLTLDLSGAPAGVQTVEVTRPSAAAVAYGTPLAALPAGARDLTVAVDGGPPSTLVLDGDYSTNGALDPAKLTAHINAQLLEHGVAATASHVGGRLLLATAQEGSARTLQLGGGAAGALALPTTEARGQSAVVTLNGKPHDIEPTPVPGMQALGTSGVSLEVGPALRTGATRANVVVTTDSTTLADLQSLVNATGSPASAAVVTAADGSRSLVLSSTATGNDGKLRVDATGGTPVLSGLQETTAAADARVSINGIELVRSSNTLTDVLPGLNMSLLAKPGGADPTVTVSRDSSGTSDKVRGLVDTLNLFLGKVASDTKYDIKAKFGGPLVGDGTARSMASQLFSSASSVTGAGSIRGLAQIGIETTRDGRFAFKPDVLTAALARDPDGVAATIAAFGDDLATYAKQTAATGGMLTSRRDGAQANADARQRQLEAMDVRLASVEKRYKAQFAALETSMASLNSQRSAMGAALNSFTSRGNG